MGQFLGEKLKKYRQVNNLTQKQLAEQLYVSDKTISKWERGAGNPDVETLKEVSQLLEISMEDLLREQEPNFYFEYKSQKSLWGLPLLHIILPNLGLLLRYQLSFPQRGWRRREYFPTAKGILCGGIFAKGIFSVGLFSCGIFSFGLLSVGLLAGGGASLGLATFGNLTIGLLLALGNVAVGIVAMGNLAVGYFSLGNLALGVFAIGNRSWGQWAYNLGDKFDLSDIQVSLHSLQLEAIPDLARTVLINPLSQLFSSEVLLVTMVIALVGVILLGIGILLIALFLKIVRTSRFI